METQDTTAAMGNGMAADSPQPELVPSPSHQPAIDPAIEERRRKWREDKRAARLRRQNGVQSPRPAGVPVSAPAGPSHSSAPGLVPAPPVPWCENDPLISDLVKEAVRIAETADRKTLKAKAEKFSPEFAAIVERDAAWPEMSKGMVEKSAPAVIVKYLNIAGIGRENLPEAALGIGLIGIWTSRNALISKMDEMIKNHAVDKSKEEPKS